MRKNDWRRLPGWLREAGGIVSMAMMIWVGDVSAQQPEESEGEGVSIQFPNMELPIIVEEYERLTGTRVIRDTAIQGATLTVETSGKLSREEAAEFIEKSLLLNGYALVPGGEPDVLKIIAFSGGKQPRSEGVPIITHPEDLPTSDEVVTFVMPLDFLDPGKAAETFTQIIPGHQYGDITPLENAAAVVITENSLQIRRLIELRNQIDVPPSQLEDRAFQLTRADAEKVAESLAEILDLGSSGGEGGAGGGGASGTGASQSAANQFGAERALARLGAGGLPSPRAVKPKIQALTRTNRVLVVARPVDMTYIEQLIEHFDAPAELASTIQRKLKYLPVSSFLPIAEDLLLQGLGGQERGGDQISGGESAEQGTLSGGDSSGPSGVIGPGSDRFSGGGSGGGFGGAGSGADFAGAGQDTDTGPQSLVIDKTLLVADNVHNTLIVSGPPEHLERIDELLDWMDVRPRQIQISAIIAQLTLGDDFQFGFDVLRTLENPGTDGARYNGAGVFQSRTGQAQPILDIDQLDMVNNFLPAAQGLTLYGQINPYLNSFLSTLQSTDRFRVLSRPTVYTLNNRQATIQTGQRVAVPRSTLSSLDADQAATNQIVTANIDFEEVLLRIEVLPLINAENEITLRINQLNDDIVGSQTIGGDQIPTIGTQSLGTTVMVPDGSTVLLGGLISEEENDNESGLPLFANVPLLGKAIGSTSESSERQELLIFLQPKIIDNPRERDAVDRNLKRRARLAPEAAEFATDKPPRAVPLEGGRPSGEKPGWLRRFFRSRGE